jgi:hypothetical protein
MVPANSPCLIAHDKLLDRPAGRLVIRVHLFSARGQAARLFSQRKYGVSGLDSLLGFEDSQEIKGADLNDSLAISHDDTRQNRSLLT